MPSAFDQLETIKKLRKMISTSEKNKVPLDFGETIGLRSYEIKNRNTLELLDDYIEFHKNYDYDPVEDGMSIYSIYQKIVGLAQRSYFSLGLLKEDVEQAINPSSKKVSDTKFEQNDDTEAERPSFKK
jgi:hypothetical protein